MSEVDWRKMCEKANKMLNIYRANLREAQLALCPDFLTCADKLAPGEKCACGFEDGPYANAVPKNRLAK